MFRVLKICIGTGLMLLFCSVSVHGQNDPLFSQYMFSMQTINPAYAGMWEKIGFSSLVRKQWTGINRSPLTEYISLHSPLNNELVGVGLNIMNDSYGREERFSVLADYSYEISLTPKRRLRFGLKLGFLNYKNPLTEYQLYPDDQYDEAFSEDVDLKFLPNFGVGAFLYEEDYYISLSVPKFIENSFDANVNNYSSLAEVRSLYLGAGYVFKFITLNYMVFKPTFLVKATKGMPLEYDISGNILLRDKLWLGLVCRSGNAVSFISNWLLDNNLRVGFAMDLAYNEIFPYQYGTYEVMLSFDVDFFGRNYIRSKYF